MHPVSNNSMTMDSVNWPYLEKILNPSKLYKISATTVAKSCGLAIEKL